MGVKTLREFGAGFQGAPKADPEVSTRDVVIKGPAGNIPTRIFTPTTKTDRPRGIYLHTHGGGYVMFGGLDTMHNWNTRIAKETGCIVVGPDFRLPPEHPFPAALEDCFSAFQWTAANAEELGGRADGICVGGGCTGGNIAAVVALMARDAGGPRFASQYLIATVFDTRADYRSHYENSEGYMLSHDDCLFVYEQYLQNMDHRWDWRASPILVPSVKGSPPTYIHVGEWDVLRDESRAYADRLRDAGVDVTLVVAPQESHGPTPASEETVYREMRAFLERTCVKR
ncbi:MAG: alpha/beta hydrolase [Alphaproteobacteria bacterium]|nr:alpha/beta hydrolase [Alphaproteobacteria bacterium]